MFNNKRLISVLVLVLVLSLSVTAGAWWIFGDDESKQEEQVNLTLGGWFTKDSLDAIQKKVKEYSKTHSNVKVEVASYPDSSTFFQNLQAQLASGTAPDMFLIEPNIFPKLIEGDSIAPVGKIMKEVGYDTNDIYDSLIDGYKVDGKLYAIPADFNMLALYYNKGMLKKAGVEVPTTYQELRTAAKKLTTDEVYGLNVDPIIGRIMPVLEAFGGKIYKDGEIKLSDPGKIKGMEYLLSMYNEKSAVTNKMLGTGWPGATFAKQKVAMAISGTWTMGYLRNNVKDFNWGVAPLPKKGDQSAQLMFSGAYAVSSSSEHKKEAVKFLKWYLNPENVLEGFKAGRQSIPVQKSYRDEVVKTFPKIKPLLQDTQSASMFYFGKQGQKFKDEINVTLEELVYKNEKNKNIDKAFKEIENQF